MNDDIQKKIIEICGLDMKSGISKTNKAWKMVKIVDEHGNKYSFFTTKQDGTDCKAYAQFKNQGVNLGKKIGIAYKETPGSFIGKEGKAIAYKQRNIIFFSEPNNIEEFNYVSSNQSLPFKEEYKDINEINFNEIN